jgi:hypothetical protein
MTSDFDGLPERVPYRRIALGEAALSGANPLPISAAALPLPAGAATSAAQTTGNNSLANIETARGKLYDTVTGTYLGLRYVDGQPRIVNQTYLQAMGEGNIPAHSPWSKIGFTPTMGTTESDVWSLAGVYVFPPSAMQMEVISSNAADTGTVIHSGVDTDAGGSATTLIKTGENFQTTTVAGDHIVIDAGGTTPEWGIITSVDSNTQITFAGGLSSGGTGASRATYAIIDKSATAGAQVIKVDYLNGSYAEKTEIAILNGTTAVATVATTLYRINSFRVICAGANEKPTGNLSIRETDDAPTYSYITAGFTRARNCCYTVPAGKTLYVVQYSASWATTGNANKEYARVYTRANVEPATKFNTGSLFYPYTEISMQNTTAIVPFDIPTKLPAKTDIKVSGIATATGSCSVVLRGWLE